MAEPVKSDPVSDLNPFKRRPAEGAAAPRPGRHSKPARPKAAPTGGKKDLSEGLGMAYGIAGSVLDFRSMQVHDQPSLPGRIMQVQAPVAGKKLNQWVKSHDFLYAVFAPVFGAKELDLLTDVVGPPLLGAIIQSRPELYPMFRPMLLPMLRKLFLELQRVQRAEEKALTDVSGMMGEEADEGFMEFLGALGLVESEGPPEPEPPESPEPEPESNVMNPNGETVPITVAARP